MTVRPATAAAVSASISTPVCPVTRAVAPRRAVRLRTHAGDFSLPDRRPAHGPARVSAADRGGAGGACAGGGDDPGWRAPPAGEVHREHERGRGRLHGRLPRRVAARGPTP